ncbi:MAG: sigma-54-dependent transcriptional regulator [Gemmatimonadota bacterium]
MTTVAAAHRILIVDDDRAFRRSTAELLRQEGYAVDTAEDSITAGEAIQGNRFDLVLLDLRMPGVDGMGVVETLRLRGEHMPILMVSGFGSIDAAVNSLQLGADDFLSKPVDPEVLCGRVAGLLERRPLDGSGDGLMGIVGQSAAMREVFASVRQVAPTDTTVLLSGDTGTGKELFARCLHELSARSTEAFIPINCAGLSEGLLESELFGHVKGAFTGAVADKKGLFEAAHGGSLFLDEIGDMSLRLQQRLLRVLQEREVTPVGAVATRAVDVRVIAATHRDLREEVAESRFREDLFYRLNIFPISLPRLSARRGDVPLLVERAIRRLRERSAHDLPATVSPFAMRLLQSYEWPGNVRELFAAVESAAIRAGDNPRIEAQHLPARVRGDSADDSDGGRYQADASGPDEKASISAALEEAQGVRTKAAELLGMSRTTLWRKMRDYGLEPGGDQVGHRSRP